MVFVKTFKIIMVLIKKNLLLKSVVMSLKNIYVVNY
jgi:hypothetical protein